MEGNGPMPANDHATPSQAAVHPRPNPVASVRHFVGFLLIGAGVVCFGFLAQHGNAGGAQSSQLASHAVSIRIYLVAIAMDWALFYYCWVGVHHRGGSLWSLAGTRWNSLRSFAVDLAIVLPFWLIWEGTAYGAHWLLTQGSPGNGTAKNIDSLLPQSLLEVLVWTATCITAGICEEMVFRGYLQHQLHAYSQSAAVAIVAQGMVFGLFHAYQGWRNVAVICLLGILYGLLAGWRGNLRANIVAHAWSDFWEGWLKFLVWR
jgi:membrane protease YdiL (CAAX protease family)